jgi:hypothetical protein
VQSSDIETLNLASNKITVFPMEFALKPQLTLKQLELRGNPVRNIPQHVVKDHKALMEFVRDLRRGASCLDRVNVVLVGDGSAGKTTLKQKCLMDKDRLWPAGACQLLVVQCALVCFRCRNTVMSMFGVGVQN